MFQEYPVSLVKLSFFFKQVKICKYYILTIGIPLNGKRVYCNKFPQSTDIAVKLSPINSTYDNNVENWSYSLM